MSWNDFSYCKGAPTEVFFPTNHSPNSLDLARQYCERCPVKQPCLEWALTSMSTKEDEGGMYGGTTMKQRRVMRRQRRQLELSN